MDEKWNSKFNNGKLITANNMILEELLSILDKFSIDISLWTGKNGTKTASDLCKEINDGESELIILPSNELQRICHVLSADIYYLRDDGVRLRLKEDKQVSKIDGSIKRRGHLRGAVSEKMKLGENIKEAISRGLLEELGIAGGFEIGKKVIMNENRSTSTYPGLSSTYQIHAVSIMLDSKSFKSEGYFEEQETKITYFVWEELGKLSA